MRIVIYGANEMASAIAAELFEDHDVIIIDPCQKKLDTFARLDIGLVCADALNINILKDADIESTDAFIALTDDDEINIIACLMAKQVSDAQTICFVSKKESMESINSLKDEYKNSYAQNIDNVISALHEVDEDFRKNSPLKKEVLSPMEVLGLDKFDDSAIVVRARIKTKPIKQWEVGRAYNKAIKEKFDQKGIQIPFPQCDVHFFKQPEEQSNIN